ncbi:hypothetical protein [Pararhizobium gei]|uniref:hypothetical protein n=1 Tax=Pararhizobium gei TaxID=1395951 RepID=UPI0023D98D11|nr:hypothetical protein [Rhizobium gei]
MRLILRFASFLALIAGVLVASVDAIQSVSASGLVLTPLATALSAGGALTGSWLEMLERAPSNYTVFGPVIGWALRQPAFVIFMISALLLWMGGYRRPQPAGRFSA